MSGQDLISQLQDRFPNRITGVNLEAIDPWIEVAADGLVDVCTFLRDDPSTRFDFLSCISGVDYFEPDEKKAKKVDWEPHLEVVYHLWSVANKTSLVIKVMLPRWQDGVEGLEMSGQEPPSLVSSAMLEAEYIMLVTNKSLSHTDARREASKKGARIASMPGVTEAMLKRMVGFDQELMKRRSLRIQKILERSGKVRITTKLGTDLVMQIKGRRVDLDDGDLSKQGAFGNLPAGEVSLSPIEGTTEGILIIDILNITVFS